MESEYLPREKIKVLTYLKGSKHGWDVFEIECTNYFNVLAN